MDLFTPCAFEMYPVHVFTSYSGLAVWEAIVM